jgi:hypothetical protein
MILYPKNPILYSWNTVWGANKVNAFDINYRAIIQNTKDKVNIYGRKIISNINTKLKGLDDIRQSITKLFTIIQFPKLDFIRGIRFNSEAEANEL